MAEKEPYVLFFEEIDGYGNEIALVGGKNASLGEMTSGGIPVPPGFAITTRAYKDFLKINKLNDELGSLLASVKKDEIESVETVAGKIEELFLNSPIPNDISEAIEESYEKLCKRVGYSDIPVAVRSSATAEDMPGASFAGQQATYLFVRSGKEVKDKVLRCWASLYSPTAIMYRLEMGYAHEAVFISVGVQKMVNAYSAGVMFTLNPITGDPATIVINSNFGVGESVVSGEVTPDEFSINKITYEIFNRVIGPKEECYVVDVERRGLVKKKQDPEKMKMQSISDEELFELAKLGKRIEKHYGRHMDVEWAIEKESHDQKGEIFVLQARPETVWSQKSAEKSKKEVDVLGMIVERLKKGKRVIE